LCERLAGERHQRDPIVAATPYEVRGDGLGGFQPIRLQVFGEHRARYVHHHDDVDALREQGLGRHSGLGARERDDHRDDSDRSEDARYAG